MRPHLWMVFAAGVALSACTANEGPPPRIASIDIGSPVDSILNQGASVQFSAIARDSRGQVMTQALTWQSSNPGAAAVSATGVVAALTPGRTTIQVTVPSGIPLTYHWFFNGTNLMATATNSTLTLSN